MNRLLAAGFTLALMAAPLRAEDPITYRGWPIGSKVKLDGSSNVHDWSMEGAIISGKFIVPAGVTLDSTQAAIAGASDGKLAATADVTIPVTSMKSTGMSGLDEAMQDAMKAPEFPLIKYHLTDMTLKGTHAANSPFQFDTKGELTVCGVTNKINMVVTIENGDKGKLKISGVTPLKMTDFKIKPPVKLGVFRTVDDIKISFDWIVGVPKKGPADAPK